MEAALEKLGQHAHVVLGNGSVKKKGEDQNSDARARLAGTVDLHNRRTSAWMTSGSRRSPLRCSAFIWWAAVLLGQLFMSMLGVLTAAAILAAGRTSVAWRRRAGGLRAPMGPALIGGAFLAAALG